MGVLVTAGTADLPVAAECTAVLGALGFAPHLLADCGVAGLHRLLAELDTIAAAAAVVVVAGMDGALASVVGGLTPAPVVAVPTSTGYGAALEGVTALLTMLSSCSSGVISALAVRMLLTPCRRARFSLARSPLSSTAL